jgi:hypothetical protein
MGIFHLKSANTMPEAGNRQEAQRRRLRGKLSGVFHKNRAATFGNPVKKELQLIFL